MKDDVICEREFVALIGDNKRPFLVQWMQPQSDQNGWRCDYVINWPERPVRRKYAMGVDSVQALILALSIVETELQNGHWPVEWFDGQSGLGLPVLP